VSMHAASRVNFELTADAQGLRIEIAGGIHIVVPLERICGYGAEMAGDEGIWVRIAAAVNDATGDYNLDFESTSLPVGDRHSLLEQLDALIGSRVVRSRFHRAPEPPHPELDARSRVKVSEPAPPPVEPEPAPAPVEPPPAFAGPELPPAAVDADDWLMIWPLADTVALSRGELLRPPDGT
jgi:hypothetical protein